MIDDGQHLTNIGLKSISESGFRGSKKNIEFEVSRDANFLIGRNGTGKTTLINIISDCLSCRYQSLMTAPFESATITFRSADKRHPDQPSAPAGPLACGTDGHEWCERTVECPRERIIRSGSHGVVRSEQRCTSTGAGLRE